MYVSPEARIMIRPLYRLRKSLRCPMYVKLDEPHNVCAENNIYGASVFRSLA
jgi:hypothetical protein